MPGVCIIYQLHGEANRDEFFLKLADFHAKQIAPGVRFAANILSADALHDLLRPHLAAQDMLLVFTAIGPAKWSVMPDTDWPLWLEQALRVPRRR